MPGMNGAQTLAAIRSEASIADVPVVLLTSVDHRVAVRELKLAGASSILTKPARAELLLATITEALGGVLFTPSAKSMFAFGLLVLVLLFRPQGILGKRTT